MPRLAAHSLLASQPVTRKGLKDIVLDTFLTRASHVECCQESFVALMPSHSAELKRRR